MKRIIIAALAFTGLATGLHAQNPPQQLTLGTVNCRWWLASELGVKLGFVIGFNAAKVLTHDQALTNYDNSEATNGDIVRGLDALCAVPENGNLPVHSALFAFVLQSKGTPKEKINIYLQETRKSYSSPGKEGKPQ